MMTTSELRVPFKDSSEISDTYRGQTTVSIPPEIPDELRKTT